MSAIVMQLADYWLGKDPAKPLDRAASRRVLSFRKQSKRGDKLEQTLYAPKRGSGTPRIPSP